MILHAPTRKEQTLCHEDANVRAVAIWSSGPTAASVVRNACKAGELSCQVQRPKLPQSAGWWRNASRSWPTLIHLDVAPLTNAALGSSSRYIPIAGNKGEAQCPKSANGVERSRSNGNETATAPLNTSNRLITSGKYAPETGRSGARNLSGGAQFGKLSASSSAPTATAAPANEPRPLQSSSATQSGGSL
jgi:hypothetical protein